MGRVPPQTQVATRGQRLDDLRNEPRSYAWPGKPTVWTYTISVWAAGTFTLAINGIQFSSTSSTDAPTAILELLADFNSKPNALELAFVTANSNVLTIQAYAVDTAFTVTEDVVPGAATTALVDATNPTGRLLPGVFIAQDETDPAAIRELRAGDTADKIIGVTTENLNMALSDGDPDSVDGWDPGTDVSVTDEGLIPVAVTSVLSSDIAVGDAVHVQIQSPGGEEIGAARDTSDGANTVQLTSGARYNGAGYDDSQGRATVEMMVRLP